jgi:carbonic anhydrase
VVSDLSTLYERNEAFVEEFDKGDLSLKPNLSTVVLTCIDARVVPAYFAGLEPGDAHTMRTVGGRVTSGVALEVSMLWMLMSLQNPNPSMELAIIHHTDCGMARFADPDVAAAVSERFGSDYVVDTYAFTDPAESLATDVQRLRDSALVPRELRVSGHIYDVRTGRLTNQVATARIG